ncbi:GNAT family N-acetyltransferase [Tenacibaculum aestuariivivum]|uniref:GNAT family N-acetyltransferase n=1 Tax=Tenacibaculum aestuariivivum TaxID=2006131 RepID=UPI003AB5273F
MYKKFESERLLLIPTLEQDAELIYQLMNTPKFLKYVGDRKLYSVKAAEKYIQEKMIPQLNTHGYSNYSLIKKTDGTKVGTCGLYDRKGLAGVDIGFGLLPQYERLGYAHEAACRLMQAAIDEFQIEQIIAITSKDNISSQKLLEKLGLEIVGVTTLPNNKEELLLYKLKTI